MQARPLGDATNRAAAGAAPSPRSRAAPQTTYRQQATSSMSSGKAYKAKDFAASARVAEQLVKRCDETARVADAAVRRFQEQTEQRFQEQTESPSEHNEEYLADLRARARRARQEGRALEEYIDELARLVIAGRARRQARGGPHRPHRLGPPGQRARGQGGGARGRGGRARGRARGRGDAQRVVRAVEEASRRTRAVKAARAPR